LSRFGCPENIITDNVAAFKSKKMMDFEYIKQILTSLGEVSECFGEEEEGEVRHASLELLQGKIALHL